MSNKQNVASAVASSAPSLLPQAIDEHGKLPLDSTRNASRRRPEQSVEDLLKYAKPALVQKAIDKALSGDGGMLQYCLNRISVLDMRTAVFTLPEIEEFADLAKATSAIMNAMAARTITTQEGVHYAHLMRLYADIMCDGELSARIADLEERQAQ